MSADSRNKTKLPNDAAPSITASPRRSIICTMTSPPSSLVCAPLVRSTVGQTETGQMGLSMGDAAAALKLLQVRRYIKVEARTLEPDDPAFDLAPPAILQVANQAEAAELSSNDIRRPAHDDISPRKIL